MATKEQIQLMLTTLLGEKLAKELDEAADGDLIEQVRMLRGATADLMAVSKAPPLADDVDHVMDNAHSSFEARAAVMYDIIALLETQGLNQGAKRMVYTPNKATQKQHMLRVQGFPADKLQWAIGVIMADSALVKRGKK